MAKLNIDNTVSRIFRSWEEKAILDGEGLREHLGCSLLGGPCERAIWYGFRWVKEPSFPGRILRLFNTGQLEEPRLVEDLRRIGVEVHDVDPATGQQFRVSGIGGHLGGSMDGAAKGLMEAPGTWHVLEFKTSGDWSFKQLQSKGVAESKPEHYAQMMLYMGGSGMTRAFYLVRNKNTDDLYQERVSFNQEVFMMLLHKARRIITADDPPERISDDITKRPCSWCDYKEMCHGPSMSELHIPAFNCRTCAHSSPCVEESEIASPELKLQTDPEARGGKWICHWSGEFIPPEVQKAGCSSHLFHPSLMDPLQSVPEIWMEHHDHSSGTQTLIPYHFDEQLSWRFINHISNPTPILNLNGEVARLELRMGVDEETARSLAMGWIVGSSSDLAGKVLDLSGDVPVLKT